MRLFRGRRRGCHGLEVDGGLCGGGRVAVAVRLVGFVGGVLRRVRDDAEEQVSRKGEFTPCFKADIGHDEIWAITRVVVGLLIFVFYFTLLYYQRLLVNMELHSKKELVCEQVEIIIRPACVQPIVLMSKYILLPALQDNNFIYDTRETMKQFPII